MAEEKEKEKFLSRWSRLKNESKDLPQKTEDAPAPVLPPVDKLTPESDFTGFMHPKVDDALRRVALKKLFSDPHFNVPDPFEAYSGDWTGGEPIPEEMLATLNQARTLLFDKDDKEKKAQEAAAAAAAQGAAPATEQNSESKDDDAGRKDA
jgi:uncharacterized protein DUF3306